VLGIAKNQPGACASFLPKKKSNTSKQLMNFLLQKVFEEVIHPSLHHIFTNLIWENKLDTETLQDFMDKQVPPPSNKEYKNAFDKGQKTKILNNPECDEFDISLYYKALLVSAKYNTKLMASPTLMGDFKDKLQKVKDIRNPLLHDLLIVPELDIKMYAKELKILMSDIFDIIGDIFACRVKTDYQKKIVQERINDTMKLSSIKKIIINLCMK